MKIGLTYDLKDEIPLSNEQPDDALEEYDSPETIEAIALVLESLGHSVTRLSGGKKFIDNIIRNNVDFVFNIAEGRGTYRSREAQIPAVLEMLDIPYSGSDPQCLALCLDKPLTKTIVQTAGIRTPRWQRISNKKEVRQVCQDSFPLPAFVKPAFEGSSKGVRLNGRVETNEQMSKVSNALLERYGQPVMIEEFVPGDEVTVGVLGNAHPKIIGIMRILPRKKKDYFIYSLEVKRDWQNQVVYECPAQLEASTLRRLADFSLKIFQTLGCRDVARIDFKLDHKGVPFFLEINPLPGLNPKSSDLPIMAAKMGWDYQKLVSSIFNAALGRYRDTCLPVKKVKME